MLFTLTSIEASKPLENFFFAKLSATPSTLFEASFVQDRSLSATTTWYKTISFNEATCKAANTNGMESGLSATTCIRDYTDTTVSYRNVAGACTNNSNGVVTATYNKYSGTVCAGTSTGTVPYTTTACSSNGDGTYSMWSCKSGGGDPVVTKAVAQA